MLSDFVADLAAIRPRIDDQSFNLACAGRRFATVLGAAQDPDTANALGTHGKSVIRLAGIAGELMSHAGTVVLREFAAAAFLQSFPQWRAHLDNHLVQSVDLRNLQQVPSSIAALDAKLTDRVGIAPASLRRLNDLSKAVRGHPEDPIAASGLLRRGQSLWSRAAGVWINAATTGIEKSPALRLGPRFRCWCWVLFQERSGLTALGWWVLPTPRVPEPFQTKSHTQGRQVKQMARRTGLEPATPGVTGRYSNQLSYHRASAYRLPGVWIYYESGGAASSGVWRACRKTLT